MHTTQPSLLIRLRKPGDDSAWSRFVELYTPLLYYWARRVNLSGEEASDLVQDVFALLLEKLPRFEYDQTKGFRSWLRAVTMNKWRERLRKKSAGLLGEESLAAIPDTADAEQKWEAEYHQHVVKKALEIMQAEFEPATWKACWEMVVEGRPAAAIGPELGLSENAVYLAKGRVLRRLKQELAGLLD